MLRLGASALVVLLEEWLDCAEQMHWYQEIRLFVLAAVFCVALEWFAFSGLQRVCPGLCASAVGVSARLGGLVPDSIDIYHMRKKRQTLNRVNIFQMGVEQIFGCLLRH